MWNVEHDSLGDDDDEQDARGLPGHAAERKAIYDVGGCPRVLVTREGDDGHLLVPDQPFAGKAGVTGVTEAWESDLEKGKFSTSPARPWWREFSYLAIVKELERERARRAAREEAARERGEWAERRRKEAREGYLRVPAHKLSMEPVTKSKAWDPRHAARLARNEEEGGTDLLGEVLEEG